MAEYLHQIREHYAASWGPPTRVLRWPHGPIGSIAPEFSVLAFRRSDRTVAFATLGMSMPHDEHPLELHLLARAVDAEPFTDEIVELLAVVAHFHRDGHPLGVGHTVDFGRGWVSGSQCTCGLLSLPYLDGPKLEWMDSPRARFLWVVPITPHERAFKQAHGLEALERVLEQSNVDVFDARRASVTSTEG